MTLPLVSEFLLLNVDLHEAGRAATGAGVCSGSSSRIVDSEPIDVQRLTMLDRFDALCIRFPFDGFGRTNVDFRFGVLADFSRVGDVGAVAGFRVATGGDGWLRPRPFGGMLIFGCCVRGVGGFPALLVDVVAPGGLGKEDTLNVRRSSADDGVGFLVRGWAFVVDRLAESGGGGKVLDLFSGVFGSGFGFCLAARGGEIVATILTTDAGRCLEGKGRMEEGRMYVIGQALREKISARGNPPDCRKGLQLWTRSKTQSIHNSRVWGCIRDQCKSPKFGT